MTQTKTRAWIAGAVVVSLLLAVAAWFLLISPKRAVAAESREQTVAVADQNDQLRLEIAQLEADYANLPQFQAELEAIRRAIPRDDRLNQLTRDATAQAEASNVVLHSITTERPKLVEDGVAEAAAAAEAAEDADTEAGAAESADTVAPAATPSAGKGTLVQVPLQILVKGNFQNTETFLRSLQTSIGQDFLVIGLNVSLPTSSPGFTATNGDVEMVISGFTFAYLTGEDAADSAAALATAN